VGAAPGNPAAPLSASIDVCFGPVSGDALRLCAP
jgi:hypothetical protein